jgi:hypothetical protein
MAQYIKPVVAEVSPNLYAAAKSAGLSGVEKNQVEQMSYTIKKHRELAKLGVDGARKEYDRLDPSIQDQLKFMFKDAEYMQEAPDATDRVMGAVGTVAKIAASPLIGLFKIGGQYNRLINTPYKVARQVAQGEDLFSSKTWTDAWDGKNQYDQGALTEATNYFGKFDVLVARGLLEGKTPGEIVQDFGKVDPNLLNSIKKAYDDPDAFAKVVDGVKYAQVSPGRDIARMLDRKPPSSGVSGSTKNVSGVIDFIYQIAVDPLTWMTGGLSKGVTKGERIANSLTEAINKGVPVEKAVETTFKDPLVFNLWQDGIGPAIKRVADSTNPGDKSLAIDNIAKNFPGYNDPNAIKTLSEAKVFDAQSAQKFFEDAGNLNLLLAGRVDGVTYMRNGVAVARQNRLFSDAITRSLDGIFNNMSRTGKERDEALTPITAALLNTEDALQRLINPNADMSVILQANKEIKGWKKIGQMAARSPQGLEVRIGANAVDTAFNFTARARQILPKEMAQALTVRFLDSTADEQIVILRNLDAATMYSMGLGGSVKGEELIIKTLQDKYGDKAGFATKRDLAINPEHAKYAPANTVRESESGFFVNTEGPIQPYQTTWAVGPLPYDVIGSTVWEIKSKKNIVNALGGATQGSFSKKLVDSWSILTLFPRLGVRSAIDEATMYLLSAPNKDLRKFASLEGLRLGNMSRASTGSKSATGPIRDGIQKALSFIPNSNKPMRIGKQPRYSHEEALTLLDRQNILEAKAIELGVDPVMLSSLEKRQAISEHVSQMYGRYVDPESAGYLMQAFVHSPDALNSMASSVVAASGISGRYGDEVAASVITPSMLDMAFEQLGINMGKGTRTIDTGMLTEQEAALAHFEKWFKMLAGNKVKLSDERTLNPADIFFRYNALKPGEIDPRTGKEMMELALDAGMKKIGFEFSDLTKTWVIKTNKDQQAVNAFLERSMYTVQARAKGLDDEQIVRGQLFRMFTDMYETFHGDANKFNETLLNVVRSSYGQLQKMAADSGRIPSWNEAVARIPLDEFQDASKGFRISGPINTELAFGDFDVESVFRRYGNTMMDMMDKQVTGIFRQPAIMVTYAGLRKKYKGIEKEFVRQQVKNELGPFAGATQKQIDDVTEKYRSIAEKRFTELAVREAADTILKFADNPKIRSNFSFSLRTVGRYYRATEDFYRRLYRLKDVAPRTLYRLRLSNVGIEASGAIFNDAEGEPYVVMPMDNVIFKATDGAFRALTGNTGYSQPLFNEFTFKLRMVNPSFSQDAGLPTLSGPIAGLGVIAVKNILGVVPGKIPFVGGAIQPYSQQLGESIDTFALGNIGDNVDVFRAVVPSSLQRVWGMLPFDEKSRQETTAAMQAIAYNASRGIGIDPNASDEEKAKYLDNIRISAHNVLFMRHFLGLFSPVAPTTMESVGVPDYIKETGISSLRSEFFDILNGITAASNGDIADPYEEALATYIGTNPGKLIYTVSREDKQTRVLIKNTDKLKNWGIKNAKLVEQYGEAAYIFAPQIGDFNAATYNWIQSAGLVKSKTIEKYYRDMQVAEDKQKYYDVGRQEREILNNMSDPQLRANVIKAATQQRAALKANNPLLNSALIGEGNTIGNEQVLMSSLEQMISNPSVEINAGTRQRMALAVKMMREFIAFSTDSELKNVVNRVQLKAERKAQIEANLKELMLGDLYVAEANRAIFRSILNFYSRDSSYAYKELM